MTKTEGRNPVAVDPWTQDVFGGPTASKVAHSRDARAFLDALSSEEKARLAQWGREVATAAERALGGAAEATWAGPLQARWADYVDRLARDEHTPARAWVEAVMDQVVREARTALQASSPRRVSGAGASGARQAWQEQSESASALLRVSRLLRDTATAISRKRRM